MPTPNEHPEVANLKETATRHITKVATARRGLAIRRSELTQLMGALEKAIDAITSPYSRYRIRRWQELTVLLLLTIAEVVVAETVVQALGLSATATDLVAVALSPRAWTTVCATTISAIVSSSNTVSSSQRRIRYRK